MNSFLQPLIKVFLSGNIISASRKTDICEVAGYKLRTTGDVGVGAPRHMIIVTVVKLKKLHGSIVALGCLKSKKWRSEPLVDDRSPMSSAH